MDRPRIMSRKPPMYINVLHIASIHDAVQEASCMLRRGILHAISSNAYDPGLAQPDPSHPSSAGPHAPASALGSASSTESASRLAASSAQAARDRDPLSVYSAAVAKRPRKAPPAADGASSSTSHGSSNAKKLLARDPLSVYAAAVNKPNASKPTTNKPAAPNDSTAQSANIKNTNNENREKDTNAATITDKSTTASTAPSAATPAPSALQSSKEESETQPPSTSQEPSSPPSSPPPLPPPPPPKESTRSWDNNKKAGPSILTKRTRSSPDAPSATSVFQPVAKRERRERPKVAATASASTSTGSDGSDDAVKPSGGDHVVASKIQPKEKVPSKSISTPVQSKAKPSSKSTSTPTGTNIATVAVISSSNGATKAATSRNGGSGGASSKSVLLDGKKSTTIGVAKAGVTKPNRGGRAGGGKLVTGVKVTKGEARTATQEEDMSGTFGTMAGAASAMAGASVRGRGPNSRRGQPTSWSQVVGGGVGLDGRRGMMTPLALLRQKMATENGGTKSSSMASSSSGVRSGGDGSAVRGMGTGTGRNISGNAGVGLGLGAVQQRARVGLVSPLQTLRQRMTMDTVTGKPSAPAGSVNRGGTQGGGMGRSAGVNVLPAEQREMLTRRGGIALGTHTVSMAGAEPPTMGAVSSGAAKRSVGPTVQFVPGSESIGGVKANGYTVSSRGVVQPVVSFAVRGRVPHKLRQTSVEKMFQVLRDECGVTEGEALRESLGTEQEMYVQCSSRVDYRGAMVAKLKEYRQAAESVEAVGDGKSGKRRHSRKG